MKKVLLVTGGSFHPPFLARKALHKTLTEMDGFEFQHVRSMEKLPSNLQDFSAIVIYIHHKKISEQALATLDDFVSSGGGTLGVHSATASFQKQSHYFEILGGRFIGHGPVAPLDVRPDPEGKIFADIPAFTIKDELYIHELQPGIRPHFTARHEGQEVPIVWTYHYGQGRVCYAVPGHRTETMRSAKYQRVLHRGLVWVCGVDR
jgi:type 1 glutamine amidotransferase